MCKESILLYAKHNFFSGKLFVLPQDYFGSVFKKSSLTNREYVLHGNSTHPAGHWDSNIIPFEFDPNVGKHLAKPLFTETVEKNRPLDESETDV